MNLDNGIGALPAVQVSSEVIVQSGCRVTLIFSNQSRSDMCNGVKDGLSE